MRHARRKRARGTGFQYLNICQSYILIYVYMNTVADGFCSRGRTDWSGFVEGEWADVFSQPPKMSGSLHILVQKFDR